MKDSLKHLAVSVAAAVVMMLGIALLSKLINSSKDADNQGALLAIESYKTNLTNHNKELILGKLENFELFTMEEVTRLQTKMSSLDVVLNELEGQNSLKLNESVLDLREKIDQLNKTMLWGIENEYKKRELDAAQKEEDKKFPFDTLHNSCYENFTHTLNGSLDTPTEAPLTILKATTANDESIISRCALLLGRTSVNADPVKLEVNLTTPFDKYRISIAGTVPVDSTLFTFNIYGDEESQIQILHMSHRFNLRVIVLNTRYVPLHWHTEIYAPLNGMYPGKTFKTVIIMEENIFKIVVNDGEPTLFHNRFTDLKSEVRKIVIHPNVNIRLLTFEIILQDPKYTLITEDKLYDEHNNGNGTDLNPGSVEYND